MTDIVLVKRQLADRAQDVAMMLLPGGRKEGAEWRVGSVSGDKGQSLGVHLSGAKAGIWADFATGETGDLLDLWCQVERISLVQALDAAKRYLGIQTREPWRDPKPTYTRPAKPKCTTPQARVLDYLKEDRNIPHEIIERYRIGEDGDRIVFPFLLPDGTLALAKVREAIGGAAPKPTAANCEPVLFGWQAIPPNVREVVITEGEIDALSIAAYGFAAMSVPFGGGGGRKQQNWIENDFERMERFEKIYLALDMDEVGEQAAVEIASRLGRHRCFRVKLPRKDANECLVDGVSQEEISHCIRDAANLDPEELRRSKVFAGDVVRMFWRIEGENNGYSLPYAELHGKLLFRPAEITLWSGATGSGKSQIVSDCVPQWIKEQSRICFASLEMKPVWTLKRLVKQVSGLDRPVEAVILQAMDFLDDGLLIYEHVGKASIERLLEVFDYARSRYGCDQFIIDSLMRLGIKSDDYTGQEAAIFKLVQWAITNNVHLHLIAHSRKGDRERGAPDADDIKGASEIASQAFNIITIWRNKVIEELETVNGERPDMTTDPAVTINICKQRNGDWEGKTKLWFSLKNYQYYSSRDNRFWPRNYINPKQNMEAGHAIAL